MDRGKSGTQPNTGGGFISDVILKIRLVIKLIQDDRIDIWLKAIPVFCLIYLVVPIDLLIGPIDDAIVLYVGMDLFISLCPQDIVNQYLVKLDGMPKSSSNEEVIDVEFKEKE
ncbi:MAG: hypothetical protein J7K66_00685 [Anaerolineaceae bacterium]|nr:hypothetical protein [Anaerolineaceae bacterium]